ncbi:hypothetical protein BCR37DRAFT_28398 [Protomyces lactucae-debilis]|uniref:Thioredoxin-like protein n=1 Tax=Protomyces lactucae-debilis TaxID=2754530 RepID=A0A1Y2FDI3_PROLT|nr:uncharacterized protein BCR37DRAFT_28398 [Protomyces lactucae-debilis]ORY81982.1 hypothetical protein BCR37DRAFT_28398 [Protomyces lactucae-debilis]
MEPHHQDLTVHSSDYTLIEAEMQMTLIELFIMSRCPDAVSAEVVFSQASKSFPADARIKLECITNQDGSCKHGELECNGNKIELAVEAVMGMSFNILNFTDLYNRNFEQIGVVPLKHLDDCLSAAGLTTAQKAAVIQTYEAKGDELMQKSGKYTQSLGVRYSCTVRINGEIVGIRDNNAWKELKHGIDGSPESWSKFVNKVSNH